MARIQIEFPSAGATYYNEQYGVYSYDRYPRSSVLAGQERRTYLGEYDTEEEARKNHPKAVKGVCGCCYQVPYLNHLHGGE